MKTISLSVTQSHIDNGVKDRCDLCPVALAWGDVLPEGFCSVRVHLRETAVIDLHETAVIDLHAYESILAIVSHDEAMIAFIEAFDDGLPVAPTTFDVEIPDELYRAILAVAQ